MRPIDFLLLVGSAIALAAQTPTPSPPPQTARQALIEMFMGKSPDAFAKHLPESARQALIRKGETPETSFVQKASMIGRQMAAQGEHVETFDEGSTLFKSEKDGGHEKVELTVERDSLMGDADEIEVSIHVYRDGQPEFLPVIPSLIFSMIQQNGIWRLGEATLAAHVPLMNPDYLKGVRKKENEANETMASTRVTMIATAEASYAAKYPDRGYTCNLSDLFPKEDEAGAAAQPPQAFSPEASLAVMGLDPAADESSGYHFSLSGCNGNPAFKFQVMAVPTESDEGMKAFCADESRTLRFDANGKGNVCLSRGQVLNSAAGAPGLAD